MVGVVFLLTYTFLGYSSAAKSTPEVRTSLGLLKGSVLESRNGREYFTFTKVPFAKPPVGSLRFKDPASPEPWSGVLDASKPNPPCYQIEFSEPSGTEDCLYLNIYTPRINGSLPVMIYFFGGCWRIGMPGPPSVARYFMDEDVVLVMINYRLGALGFLSTEDEVIPGNMGLKDMIAAVKWTKREISNFGGNPDSITAIGLSAGGASSHYLCSIPSTRALLKGCISQSGVGGSHWSLRKPGAAKKTALTVADAVGCSFQNILPCLQSKTAEEITKTQWKLRFWAEEPLIIHGPVLEPKLDGAVLTEWPLPDTNFPWLTGVTTREGYLKVLHFHALEEKPSMREFQEKTEDFLKRMFSLPENNKEAVNRIIGRFFADGNFFDGYEQLYTEAYSVYPVLHELKNHKGSKYFYIFNITGGPSMWEIMRRQKAHTASGVPHGDEHPFFFDMSFMNGSSSMMSQPDRVRLSEQLIKLWTNFAKYQKPSLEGIQPEWPPFENNGLYLAMSNERFVTKQFENTEEILNFWDSIFKNYHEANITDVS